MEQQCEPSLSIVMVVLMKLGQLVNVSDIELLLVNLFIEIL